MDQKPTKMQLNSPISLISMTIYGAAGLRAHIEINRFNIKKSLNSMNFAHFGIFIDGFNEE